METVLKYVRLKQYDEIIIFPEVINHSTFKDLNPISAGFCCIQNNEIKCFGDSNSLSLHSKTDDSALATTQVFGIIYETTL